MGIQMIIKELMTHNNPDTPIKIYKRFSLDPCDPLVEDLFVGNISDIPTELQQLTVESTGWLIGAKRYAIDVGCID